MIRLGGSELKLMDSACRRARRSSARLDHGCPHAGCLVVAPGAGTPWRYGGHTCLAGDVSAIHSYAATHEDQNGDGGTWVSINPLFSSQVLKAALSATFVTETYGGKESTQENCHQGH